MRLLLPPEASLMGIRGGEARLAPSRLQQGTLICARGLQRKRFGAQRQTERKTGGEDQSYFVNPRVAGSNPASPKGNCSSIGRAAECTVVKRSSPVRKLPVSRRYSREAPSGSPAMEEMYAGGERQELLLFHQKCMTGRAPGNSKARL